MQYLIVILDDAAPSFCHYPNPNRPSHLMRLESLKRVIHIAQRQGWMLNCLVGETVLPSDYIEALDVINHVIIANRPIEDSPFENVTVLDYDCQLKNFNGHVESNLILRIDKDDLSHLTETINALKGKFHRLNVTILRQELFSGTNFNVYKGQLEMLSELIRGDKNFDGVEINILTDRLFLYKQNHCGAGIKHVTIAPNENFYLCPAFYYESPEKAAIGNLEHGISIKNQHLLRLEYAPICRVCDAYHCKRCIWLNRKTTMELNTPSHEQCLIAHCERQASYSLLNEIRKADPNFFLDSDLNEIDYMDPFEKVKRFK